MKVTFLGATGTVTGSRHLVETNGHRVLVDCGMFQGLRELRERNWNPFAVDPESIDAVVLTHAHIDHSGWLPRLVREGFRGEIWCSASTAELVPILLRDSARIHEEDARYANKHRTSRHDPALPLYTEDDADLAIKRLHAIPFGHRFHPVNGVEVTLSPAGHILGAASALVRDADGSLLFSGDVGRPNDPVMLPPATPLEADHIVTESTYGNREHGIADPWSELANVVNRTIERTGTLLIPVFAVGRAQSILFMLARLREEGRIPSAAVYVDSPMAVDTTDIYMRHANEHRLSESECDQLSRCAEFVRTVDESKMLTNSNDPKIVLAASGMLTGGRVLHHVLRWAGEKRNTILIVGYQAEGTRGHALINGATQLKVYGETVQVKCEVSHIDGLSAHADSSQLMAWLASAPVAPRAVSVVHGEPDAAVALATRIQRELGWNAEVPETGDSVTIG